MIEWNTKNVNSICKIPGLLFNYGQNKKKVIFKKIKYNLICNLE